MNEIILLKLGEMVLKGLNRRSFEDKLQANIHRRLWPYGQFKVYTRQSTTYVEPKNDECDVEGAFETLKNEQILFLFLGAHTIFIIIKRSVNFFFAYLYL